MTTDLKTVNVKPLIDAFRKGTLQRVALKPNGDVHYLVKATIG